MDEWLLIPRPERFTELYFDDHINLPKEISKGQEISFSFTIHNLEGQTTEYPYIIYFKSLDGQVVNIDESTVTLKDGEYRPIEGIYKSEMDDNSGTIVVDLKGKNQQLHFLLNYKD
jgi:uncharacterized membrane protein